MNLFHPTTVLSEGLLPPSHLPLALEKESKKMTPLIVFLLKG